MWGRESSRLSQALQAAERGWGEARGAAERAVGERERAEIRVGEVRGGRGCGHGNGVFMT